MDDLVTAKNDLRKQIRAKKKARFPHKLSQASETISLHLMRHFSKVKTILCFWPIEDEVNIQKAISIWLRQGRAVGFPAFSSEEKPVFRRITTTRDMLLGSYRVFEPHSTCPLITAKEALVLVPGLAFSRSGARLGRGKGYYDRLLTERDWVKIGVCLDEDILDYLPEEAHDVRMTYLCSEKGLFKCQTSNPIERPDH